MASSEARGPLGMFVGFLLVALGVVLWKPETKPEPTPELKPEASVPAPTNAQPGGTNVAKLAPPPTLATPPSPDAATSPAPSTAPAPPSAPAPDATLGKLEVPIGKQTPAEAPAPAAPPPASNAPAPVVPPSAEAPHFDIVRVEPTGEAVVAGKGVPNAKVELLGQGKVLGEAQADAGGNFVILPPTLAPGSYDLSLRQAPAGAAPIESKQSVAVSVPQKGGNVVVALAEPGKPTKVLSAPVAPPPAPAPVAPSATAPAATGAPRPGDAKGDSEASVVIRSVELENGNGFYASGAAKPGTPVHIYLNGAHIADVVTAPDGQWSVTLKKGLKGGHYVVRADAQGAGNAGVIARAEVPFDVPVAMAEAPAPPASSAPSQSTPLVAPPPAPAPATASPAVAPAPSPPAAPTPTEAQEASPAATGGTQTEAKRDTTQPGSQQPAAQQAQTQQATAERPSGGGANAIIAEIETAVVVRGDNLWNISRARLGHGRRFTQIYAANTAQIRNPRLIYPGQVLVVPPR